MATGTLSTIQHGSRKLLAKANPVHALKVHDGLIYSASSSLEGTSLKVLALQDYAIHLHCVPQTNRVRICGAQLDYSLKNSLRRERRFQHILKWKDLSLAIVGF